MVKTMDSWTAGLMENGRLDGKLDRSLDGKELLSCLMEQAMDFADGSLDCAL